MSETCSQHPEKASEGSCLRCGKGTCALCKVDVDGAVYCSVLCFTEGPAETPPAPAAADPLAGIGIDASSGQMPAATPNPLDDDSVVLPASQAATTDLE
ncbi:MAG TPA: hypothetical protein VNM14_24735, partial [Planctomycetota bacterium]|nr:hypothetical protein [Planctomycetota bacterium]